jgi:lysophospholipase L1-like esterase
MIGEHPMGPVRNWLQGGIWKAGLAAFFGEMTVATAIGLLGSVAFLPLVALQGAATRRRVPCLPPVKTPCRGLVPGQGVTLRMLAMGESTVAGVGLAHGDETMAAATARAVARRTGRPVAWQAYGLSGATVREAAQRLLPGIAAEPADLLVILPRDG